jgi:hypothetical protein
MALTAHMLIAETLSFKAYNKFWINYQKWKSNNVREKRSTSDDFIWIENIQMKLLDTESFILSTLKSLVYWICPFQVLANKWWLQWNTRFSGEIFKLVFCWLASGHHPLYHPRLHHYRWQSSLKWSRHPQASRELPEQQAAFCPRRCRWREARWSGEERRRRMISSGLSCLSSEPRKQK